MTKAHVRAIQSALDDFERGSLDVERLQSRLEAEAAALDNSTPEILHELRRLDAELEHIRFAVRDVDQRRDALAQLEQMRKILQRSMTSF